MYIYMYIDKIHKITHMYVYMPLDRQTKNYQYCLHNYEMKLTPTMLEGF